MAYHRLYRVVIALDIFLRKAMSDICGLEKRHHPDVDLTVFVLDYFRKDFPGKDGSKMNTALFHDFRSEGESLP